MLFSKETLKSFAQSKGISNIDDDALRVLSQDLEYRIKEVCQEGSKFMVGSKRTKLSIDDINYALISRNVDPLFGYDPQESLVFRGLPSNVYYVPDEEIDLEEYLDRPLPKIPLRPSIQSHWLAIEGVQPQIPYNPILLEKPVAKKDTLGTYQEEAELKSQNRHMLTKELSMYFDKVIQAMETDEEIAMECLHNESGIQQLVPYFIHHFNEQIVKNIKNKEKLMTVMMVYNSLLRNKYIFIDPYLHQILPSLITCVIGKSVDDEVRRVAADVVKYVFSNFSSSYKTLAPRIINTLSKAWLDKEKTESTQYGALLCLSLLSKHVVETVVKPKADYYVKEINNPRVTELLDDILKKNDI
ncbi:transcription initiation factor TFIID subunit TAF6 [Encephalitozoon intestinalis ATCC 50506]|uniref:Transcription initiation factor TFIID subunit TAF6 n=1 Tax=Encephalitozoon intestinalis (strain ATCC 50506) TaxID=876142 RepID=E0S9P7_ENCIT|nr:transcription initiation factor TFIID subunit TAF6 [Encephalitozoon intestinalis ATCC 50506]ADM12432.1 transcription initiation factor TFIID subunit TAF6 [Encephalitozoon intestinalis ATCC 50506]UTX46267.1 transcription initiation factor TFIID subunit TAF6 [Encephalitozoon intestinalis]